MILGFLDLNLKILQSASIVDSISSSERPFFCIIFDILGVTRPSLLMVIVAEQMRELNIDDFIIILEPFGRNTAPPITIAAIKALELEEDPTLLVLSSDHKIKNF